jgi:Fe2+ transport system protein FeoA
MSLELNTYYKITSVCHKNTKRFYVMGLVPNAVIKVTNIQPFNGPIIIEIGDRLIGMRRKEFECLTIVNL